SVHPEELGTTILQLAATLSDFEPPALNRTTASGNVTPTKASPSDSLDPEAADSVTESGRWLTFRPDARGLPPYCCRCDQSAGAHIPIRVDDDSWGHFGWLAHQGRCLTIEVPFCLNCRVRLSRIGIVAAIVTALCTVAGVYAAWVADGPPVLSEKD